MCCIPEDNCIIMSRAKSRGSVDTCGDCGLQGLYTFRRVFLIFILLYSRCSPIRVTQSRWVIIDCFAVQYIKQCFIILGILLCGDCASVHRSIGSHISIVKALRQVRHREISQCQLHSSYYLHRAAGIRRCSTISTSLTRTVPTQSGNMFCWIRAQNNRNASQTRKIRCQSNRSSFEQNTSILISYWNRTFKPTTLQASKQNWASSFMPVSDLPILKHRLDCSCKAPIPTTSTRKRVQQLRFTTLLSLDKPLKLSFYSFTAPTSMQMMEVATVPLILPNRINSLKLLIVCQRPALRSQIELFTSCVDESPITL